MCNIFTFKFVELQELLILSRRKVQSLTYRLLAKIRKFGVMLRFAPNLSTKTRPVFTSGSRRDISGKEMIYKGHCRGWSSILVWQRPVLLHLILPCNPAQPIFLPWRSRLLSRNALGEILIPSEFGE